MDCFESMLGHYWFSATGCTVFVLKSSVSQRLKPLLCPKCQMLEEMVGRLGSVPPCTEWVSNLCSQVGHATACKQMDSERKRAAPQASPALPPAARTCTLKLEGVRGLLPEFALLISPGTTLLSCEEELLHSSGEFIKSGLICAVVYGKSLSI